ncbi:hypothetical protein PS6_004153 [Mucor atramentarius]
MAQHFGSMLKSRLQHFPFNLHSDDDPREFLAGLDQHNTSPNATDSQDARLPLGSSHYFEFNPATGRMNHVSGGGNGNANNHGEMGDDIFQFFTPTPAAARSNTTEDGRERPPTTDGTPSPLGNIVQNLLTNILGQSPDIAAATQNNDGEAGERGDGHNHDGRPMVFFGNMVDGNVRFQSVPAGQTMPGGLPNLGATLAAAAAATNADEHTEDGENTNSGTRNNNEDRRGNHIANLLQFLSDMTGGAFDAGIVGNPNDYVFSQTALDNIITQLMEQNGGHAPPPAPEQVIESLQKRPLTDKEKSQETDCAVCKDQFESHELVIELPCEHIFHDECIKPWLKLNSTCPVCRHSVLPDQQEQDNNSNDNNNNAGSNNGPNDNTPSNATQGETNRSAADENNNNNSNNTNDNGGNGSGRRTPASGFTWVSGGNGNSEPQVASWPLNLSAFPWTETLGRQTNDNTNSNNNNNNTANTPTSNTTSTTTNNANQNNNNPHIDEDLDLDLD